MWLAYGERLPRHLRRANAVAIALTLAAMAGTGFILRRRGHDTAGIAAGVGLAWLAGHMAWGSYFCARFRLNQACQPGRVRHDRGR
jgi:hypothetical protein